LLKVNVVLKPECCSLQPTFCALHRFSLPVDTGYTVLPKGQRMTRRGLCAPNLTSLPTLKYRMYPIERPQQNVQPQR